jgi:threonine dehydrogenase-like Zn-dependent dehydrogenase
MARTMRANVFRDTMQFGIEEVPVPTPGPGEALIRVTLTTICGTDVHIVKGEYPVRSGLIIGHEPVGVIEALGAGVTGYEVGDRVLVGAVTPCGQCRACLSAQWAQCGQTDSTGYRALGGWRFGNTINGVQAEYAIVPNAQANLAKIPDDLTDEQVVLLADIASTGFSGAESAQVRIGDSVAVFALGPIGLCAAIGARLMGAALVIGVDPDPNRRAFAQRMGVDIVLDPTECDAPAEIKKAHRRRRGCRHRSAGTARDLGELPALAAPWRDALQPRRLQRQAPNPLRGVRRGHRRHQNRHHALPRRQGAHASPDGDRAPPSGRPDAAADPPIPPGRHSRGV